MPYDCVSNLTTVSLCVTGRFKEWHEAGQGLKRKAMVKNPKPSWAIAKDDMEWVESIIGQLKTPSGWPPVRKFFTDLGHMKTSETLLFASDVGAYFMRNIDIDPRYRALFIRLIRVTQRSSHTHARPTLLSYAIHHHRAYDIIVCHTVGACTRSAHRGTASLSCTSCPCS
jgi:hypothetical protein